MAGECDKASLEREDVGVNFHGRILLTGIKTMYYKTEQNRLELRSYVASHTKARKALTRFLPYRHMSSVICVSQIWQIRGQKRPTATDEIRSNSFLWRWSFSDACYMRQICESMSEDFWQAGVCADYEPFGLIKAKKLYIY